MGIMLMFLGVIIEVKMIMEYNEINRWRGIVVKKKYVERKELKEKEKKGKEKDEMKWK